MPYPLRLLSHRTVFPLFIVCHHSIPEYVLVVVLQTTSILQLPRLCSLSLSLSPPPLALSTFPSHSRAYRAAPNLPLVPKATLFPRAFYIVFDRPPVRFFSQFNSFFLSLFFPSIFILIRQYGGLHLPTVRTQAQGDSGGLRQLVCFKTN